MLNKYLEQLKNSKFKIGLLEEDIYFVLNQPKKINEKLNIFLRGMIDTINQLNDSIKKQDKVLAKSSLEELIDMLNLINEDFFNILQEKTKIDDVLINRHSLNEEETKEAFNNNKEEIKNLKETIQNSHLDLN